MKLLNKLRACGEICEVKFFKKRVPIATTWSITNDCNYQCKYCGRWRIKTNEISTEGAMMMIGRLARSGCVRIVFGGGEPLLRKDIGGLIDFCKKSGISVSLISNGYFIADKIDEIRNVDLLELSIDGIGEICDLLRGDGAYEKILKAIKLVRERKIKTILNMVLTKYNLIHVDLIIEFAIKHNLGVMFSPVSYIHFAGKDTDSLLPDKLEFKNIVNRLMRGKKDGEPIINSISALKYMNDWPHYKKIPCYSGRAFCHISSEGDFYPCAALEGKVAAVRHDSFLNRNIEDTLKVVSDGINYCEGCWCTGTLEFNRLLSLKPTAFFTFINLIKTS